MMDFYKNNSDELHKAAVNVVLPELKYVLEEAKGNMDEVIEAAHMMVDTITKKAGLWEQATCKKGCSFCCHDQIFVSKQEAEYITKKAKEKGIQPNRGRLKRQNRVNDFKKLSWKDKACSFLGEDGLCSIYSFRPVVCRNHNSVDILEKCDKRINPDSNVKEGRIVYAEAVYLALLLLTEEEIQSTDDLKSLHKELYNQFIK